MSEHTGLEFAPQSPRSQNLPSTPLLVLFFISMQLVPCAQNTKYTEGPLGSEPHAQSLCPYACRIPHFIMQVRANQLHGLANRNVVRAVPQLFWSANCIKKRHVKLLNGPSSYIRILCPCVQTSIIYVSKPPLLYIDVLHASFPN